MWNIFKTKEEIELIKLQYSYFKGDGIENLAKLQSKYNQEEHFKQVAIKEKKDIKDLYEYFQSRIDNNETLSDKEMNDYRFYKFKTLKSL